jgi:uncharacterized coiled-coil protein SlyX
MNNDDTQFDRPTSSDNVRPSPTPSDLVRPSPTMSATRSEAHTLTTREVMKIFEEANLPRAQRSIERYCHQGDLDCMPDAVERRQYITRESVDTLIGQLKEIATRHQNVNTNAEQPIGATADDDNARRPATTTTDDGVKRGTPEKHDEKHRIGEYEEKLAAQEARIKELENEKFNLEIDKRARDQVVGMLREQFTEQTKEFSTHLTQQSRRVGQLETQMRQLTGPRRDRSPTRDDSATLDDGDAIDAEFRDTNSPPAPEHDDVPTNAQQP